MDKKVETAQLTYNGKTVDLPVRHGTVGPSVIDVTSLYKETGTFTYDPGFTSTAACDSQITYRKRYMMVAARAPVVDLTTLDPFNPRSVAYQVDRIDEHLATLPPYRSDGPLSLPQKAALALATKLRTMDAVDIDDDTIDGFELDLMQLSDFVASTYRPPRWLRVTAPLAVPVIQRLFPEQFFVLVLGGEDPVDHLQRRQHAVHTRPRQPPRH